MKCFSILNGHYYEVQQYIQGWLWSNWKSIRTFRHSEDAESFFEELSALKD